MPEAKLEAITSNSDVRRSLTSSQAIEALDRSVRDISVDFFQLQNHEIRPSNIIDVDSFQGLDDSERSHPDRVAFDGNRPPPLHEERPTTGATVLTRAERSTIANESSIEAIKAPKLIQKKPRLDVASFGKQLWEILKDHVAGYTLQIVQHGKVIHVGHWKWARSPDDGAVGWNPDWVMHIASISKLITAMALVKLLQESNMSPDDSIGPHLPTHWALGPNIDQITFRRLMRHRSGFRGNLTDYWFMRNAVEDGVTTANLEEKKGHYRNMNYGLCRILIAIISGKVDADALSDKMPSKGSEPTWHDWWWDQVTVSAYASYTKDSVFEPSGVFTSLLSPFPVRGVYAYDQEGAQPGWNSGNKTAVSGGAGWHLSLKDLLKVMREFRREETIVPGTTAQWALNSGFGIDNSRDTAAGRWWEKNGRWTDGGGRTEQCVAYFLPDDMELGVFVNSFIGAEKTSLRGTVRELYAKNIK